MPVSTPLAITLSGHKLELYPGGGLYWPKHQALMVSDLHLGKDATFRRHGIGVPVGSSRATLRCVSDMLESSGATELFIIGDLFHARSSLSMDATSLFGGFLDHHHDVAVRCHPMLIYWSAVTCIPLTCSAMGVSRRESCRAFGGPAVVWCCPLADDSPER